MASSDDHHLKGNIDKFVSKKQQDLEETNNLIQTAFFLLNKYVKQSDKTIKDIRNQLPRRDTRIEQDLETLSSQVQSLNGSIINIQNSLQHMTAKTIKNRMQSCLNQLQALKNQEINSRRNEVHQNDMIPFHPQTQQQPYDRMITITPQGSPSTSYPIQYVSPTIQQHCQQPSQHAIPIPQQTHPLILTGNHSPASFSQLSVTPVQMLSTPSGLYPIIQLTPQSTHEPCISLTPIVNTQASYIEENLADGVLVSNQNSSFAGELEEENALNESQEPNEIVLPSQETNSQEFNNIASHLSETNATKSSFQAHLPCPKVKLTSDLKCPFCKPTGNNRSRPNKYVLLQHIKIDHKDKIAIHEQIHSLNPSVESLIRGNVTCFYCPLQERSKAPLFRHIRDKHENKYNDYEIICQVLDFKSSQESGETVLTPQSSTSPSSIKESSQHKPRNNARKSQGIPKRSLPQTITTQTPLEPHEGVPSVPKRTVKQQTESSFKCHLCPGNFSSKNALDLHLNFYCKQRPKDVVDRTQNLIPSLPVISERKSKAPEVTRRLRSQTRRPSATVDNHVVNIREVSVEVDQIPQEVLLKLMKPTKEDGQLSRNKRVMQLLETI